MTFCQQCLYSSVIPPPPLRITSEAVHLHPLATEPNSYRRKFNYSVAPEFLGVDFDYLRHLLRHPLENATRLVGPDVSLQAGKPRLPAALRKRKVDL